MKYKVNDVVQISELSHGQFAGEIVIITDVIEAENRYDFLIPERRGSVPEQAIERKVTEWKR